jgi:hypothetical protein
MFPSSTLVVATDSERLTRGGFSLDKTICFGILEFITDCFSGLSLSPQTDGSDAATTGLTHNGLPSLMWAMIGNSTEEFHTTLDNEGDFGLPSPGRHSTGAPPTPVTTTSWLENAPNTSHDEGSTMASNAMAGH